jgi:hypothetical protein
MIMKIFIIATHSKILFSTSTNLDYWIVFLCRTKTLRFNKGKNILIAWSPSNLWTTVGARTVSSRYGLTLGA